ncbi:MAG TPA: hypothetical protein VHM70_07805 [Polyangiaceae bacterium]|jgi:hypothetical protein|nr:hypothetical protein [Polyangiaceae bacterium]
MEIYLDRRATRQIRIAAQEAIEEGDLDPLREDILEAFGEEQVEEIERRLDSADFYEHLSDVLDEWGGDDPDELFELLETQLSEVGLDLKFENKDSEGGDRDDDRDDDEDEDEDESDDDEDEDEEDEESEEDFDEGLIDEDT